MTLLRGGSVDPLSVIIQILATLVIVFLALPLHELAHGWVAYKLGDPTAKYEGRLTLNPLASIDPMGAMFLLLFGIGWAKPVPIDSRYFKNPRSGVALTSLAGPAANLLASYVGCVIYYAIAVFAPYNAFVHYILLFFSYFSFINAVLAVFNLVPLPPLDGSKILFGWMDYPWAKKYVNADKAGLALIVFLVFIIPSVGAQFGYNWNWFGAYLIKTSKFLISALLM